MIKRVFFILLSFLLCSCVKDISLSGISERYSSLINVYGLIQEGEPVSILVGRVCTYDDDANIIRDTILEHLDVSIIVNENREIKLEFCPDSLTTITGDYPYLEERLPWYKGRYRYVSNEYVNCGDELKLLISDKSHKYKDVYASTHIPEDFSADVRLYERIYNNEIFPDSEKYDSVIVFKCGLVDNLYTEDFYNVYCGASVKVSQEVKDRYEYEDFTNDFKYSSYTGGYGSYSAIFYDKNITSHIYDNLKYFSTYFSDIELSAKDNYEFDFIYKYSGASSFANIYDVMHELGDPEVYVTPYTYEWPYCVVFEHISKEYYMYKKNYHYALCSDVDMFSEPTEIYSNVVGGNGVFAGCVRRVSPPIIFRNYGYFITYNDGTRNKDLPNYIEYESIKLSK